MHIAIMGAGSIAYGTAAYLAKEGHQPILWSPSGQRARGLAAGAPLVAKGAVEFSGAVAVADTAAEAVQGADVVILALPVNGHRMALDAIAPHLTSDQTVIISSHGSFGALYLSRLLAERGITVPIVVWGTTVVTGRQAGDTAVNVSTVRQRLDVATLPETALDHGLALCRKLFGDRFVPRDGMLAIALSNLNPQNHLGIALLNLTRMEKGENWGQGEYVTPAVGRVIEALDAERLAIAEAFGLKVRNVFEHFSLSFHVPEASVHEMNQQMHAQGNGGQGPATFASRYIFEDVPYGLAMTALLGRIAGVPAMLHEAGITMFSAAAGRDLAADNDLLPSLGLDRLSPDALDRLCRTGFFPDGGDDERQPH